LGCGHEIPIDQHCDCRLEITLRLLVNVDFRSSFYTRDPYRLNRRATDQAIMGSVKQLGISVIIACSNGQCKQYFNLSFQICEQEVELWCIDVNKDLILQIP